MGWEIILAHFSSKECKILFLLFLNENFNSALENGSSQVRTYKDQNPPPLIGQFVCMPLIKFNCNSLYSPQQDEAHVPQGIQ